jgi:hypothetical protein
VLSGSSTRFSLGVKAGKAEWVGIYLREEEAVEVPGEVG